MRTYNSALYVREALESIFAQTINSSEYEIIVLDNGSTDETLEILNAYKNRVRLVIDKDSNPIALLNKGIAMSRGSFVTVVDSDDKISPTMFESMIQAFENKHDISFVYANYYEFDATRPPKEIIVGDNIYNLLAGGILFRKKILQDLGGYDTSLIFPEYKLLYQMSKGGYTGFYIRKPLYYYRRHSQSITANTDTVKKGKAQLQALLDVDLPIREYAMESNGKKVGDAHNVYSISSIEDIKLQEATLDDAELFIAWRSNPVVYKFFREQNEPIRWTEHVNWWKSRQHRKDWIIMFQEQENWRKVGSVNVSKLDTQSPEVGIFLGELTLGGKGIATKSLTILLNWLKERSYKTARAVIHRENVASLRLFEKLGFTRIGSLLDLDFIQFERII